MYCLLRAIVLLTGLLPLAVTARADLASYDAPALYQGFIGILELEDQRGDWDEISDEGVEIDFSNLLSGGLESEYVFYEGWVHAGINPGGSIAWKSDDTRFTGGFTESTGGFLSVEVDNTVFIAELHLGGYVRGRLQERITAYASAGPMVLYGYHKVKSESVEGSDEELELSEKDSSGFALGYYARAGIDFEFREGQYLGLGMRYLSGELDFDQTVGKIDIEGPQYVLTFSRRL